MRKTASVFIGVLIGALLTEVGLRVFFHESEATRTYWGRGAFVADAMLGYRHAPSTDAWCAREGCFEPYPVRTNAWGFRDRRDFVKTNPEALRIVVGGASFTFGLGVARDEDLFHVRLERRLSQSGRFPQGVEVYNLSQTGYHIDQVCDIVREELDQLDPDVVVIAVNQYDKFLTPSERISPDFSAGYRLAPDRFLPGRPVDFMRTHAWSWMRVTNSPLLNPPAWWRDHLAFRAWSSARPVLAGIGLGSAPAGGAGAGAAVLEVPASLQSLRDDLRRRNIALVCMIIYRPGDRDGALARLLNNEGYQIVEISSRPNWVLSGDGHWNATGHEEAAALVTTQMEAGGVLPEAPRPRKARP